MNNGHLFYIRVIVEYIETAYKENKFYWMSDLEQHENVPRTPIPNPNKPPPFLIRRPDLIAEERNNSNIFIMGEAKTYNDFLNDKNRTSSQLDYYLNYLKNKPSGLLIYALPHSLKIRAEMLINEKKKQWNTPEIKSIVITDLEYSRTLF